MLLVSLLFHFDAEVCRHNQTHGRVDSLEYANRSPTVPYMDKIMFCYSLHGMFNDLNYNYLLSGISLWTTSTSSTEVASMSSTSK